MKLNKFLVNNSESLPYKICEIKINTKMMNFLKGHTLNNN